MSIGALTFLIFTQDFNWQFSVLLTDTTLVCVY
jgi:hypothetical protein